MKISIKGKKKYYKYIHYSSYPKHFKVVLGSWNFRQQNGASMQERNVFSMWSRTGFPLGELCQLYLRESMLCGGGRVVCPSKWTHFNTNQTFFSIPCKTYWKKCIFLLHCKVLGDEPTDTVVLDLGAVKENFFFLFMSVPPGFHRVFYDYCGQKCSILQWLFSKIAGNWKNYKHRKIMQFLKKLLSRFICNHMLW